MPKKYSFLVLILCSALSSVQAMEINELLNPENNEALNLETTESTNIPSSRKRKASEAFKYHCDYKEGCSFSTNNKLNLANHKRTHTGEKPFKCDLCPYAAAQKTNLTRHKRIHTGEKQFKCNWDGCNYQTVDNSVLKRHKRTHTGEKPYKCDQCDYAAARKYSLDKHKKNKHPEVS